MLAIDSQKLGELMESKEVQALEDLGGVAELAKCMGSDSRVGLQAVGDQDMLERRQRYGENKMERKPPPTIAALFWDAMQDTTIIILLAASVVSVILGAIVCAVHLGSVCPRTPLWSVGTLTAKSSHSDGPCLEWVEGIVVLAACVVVGSITAINNYKKELQFRALQAKQDDSNVTVWRCGQASQISVTQVVVGDVVQLDTGAKIPADGILIHSTDLKVDESSLTGESVPVNKNIESKPFMFAGCSVVEGDARLVVTAVGKNTEWGRIMTELDTERPDTPLQIKLADVADTVGKFGLAVAVICFVAQTLIWLTTMAHKTCFEVDANFQVTSVEICNVASEAACALQTNSTSAWKTHYENFHAVEINNLINFFIDSVTIIVVAIPEGLPLAVTISLAYSVKRMQADMNLVRVMAACETMGGATNICSDKTGTLTENLMTVTQGFFAGKYWAVLPERSDFEMNYYEALVESMASNSRAELGKETKEGRPEIIGNKTEGAMLVFLKTLGCDYREQRAIVQVVKVYPFSSAKKRMSTLVRNSAQSKDGRLYTKGASEIITGMCKRYLANDGSEQVLDSQMRSEIEENIVIMASNGLRTIGIAYAEVSDLESLTTCEDVAESESKLVFVFIGVIGIRDPPRKEVPDAVKKCQLAGIKVRMITGDNIETAKAIAKEVGILTDGAVNNAIEGPDFRKMTPNAQKRFLKTMEVMARCSPQDKLTLVRRLKEMGEVVAVTGDGTNDAPALKEADVGLSMGITGTAVAQEASDIVIMDDNFSSIVKSVMWGRSVYDNIRRFLQFQLTVNVVALMTCMAGAITGFGTPLGPVQLLWVNLIMDTLGALALATELPTPDMLLRKPYGRHDNLINGHMWRNLLTQSVWQLVFTLGILYGSPVLGFYDCVPKGGYVGVPSSCAPVTPDGYGNDPTFSFTNTLIYNTFVWAQLFNEINSRKIYNELNPFDGIGTNRMFIGIVIISGITQFITVQFTGIVFSTVPLDGVSWAISLVLGGLSIPLGVLFRLLPPFDFVNRWIGRQHVPVAPTPEDKPRRSEEEAVRKSESEAPTTVEEIVSPRLLKG